jgi:hypothetical protein
MRSGRLTLQGLLTSLHFTFLIFLFSIFETPSLVSLPQRLCYTSHFSVIIFFHMAFFFLLFCIYSVLQFSDSLWTSSFLFLHFVFDSSFLPPLLLSFPVSIFCVRWDSSVSIEIRYGLDGPGSNPVVARFFALLQTGPWVHPAYCAMGTGSLSPG